ncbi:MAG: LysM peptidoglycan-binding domain-containing protein [Anaerolineales bacterium]
MLQSAGLIPSLPLVFILAACSISPTISPTVALRPQPGATASAINVRATSTVAPIPTLGPTATPLTHQIVARDTLLGIAAQYGITLDELLAANPALNPLLLSIGQEILIPGPGGEPIGELAAPAAPAPLDLSAPACFFEGTGDLTCLLTASNPGSDPLEGIILIVTLVDASGHSLASAAVPSAAGILPPGVPLPLGVRFERSSAGGYARASAVVASAYQAPQAASRLWPTDVQETRHAPSGDRVRWELAGHLDLAPGGEETIGRVTLLASGLDAEGNLVGLAIRQWDAVHAGERLDYQVMVFSLGPPLASVIVWAQTEVSP